MILDDTSAAIYTTLTGGTALTALLAGTASVYDMRAPDGASLPYVIFQHQGGGPENVDANSLEDNIWMVKIVHGTDAKSAAEAFEQADLLINRQNISISGANTFWCHRMSNIKYQESDDAGVDYFHVGGLYRIRTG